MPHQCVRCDRMYEDGANEILKGCACGARLFFFIKKKHLEKAHAAAVQLSDQEKMQMEHDVLDMIGAQADGGSGDAAQAPVVLDFESINILKPGKYEIDLVHLFKKEPIVFKVSDGKYLIDIGETFRQARRL